MWTCCRFAPPSKDEFEQKFMLVLFGIHGLDFNMFSASLGMFMLKSTSPAKTHNGPRRILRLGDFVGGAKSQNAKKVSQKLGQTFLARISRTFPKA